MKIPEELIVHLKPFGPRYIKVDQPILGNKKSGKAAIEKGFAQRPYEAENAELQAWIERGGNYGILAGWGVFILDADDTDTIRRFEATFDTFTVKSGTADQLKKHFYFRGNFTENGVETSKGKNKCNLQVRDRYVVGPNCKHWSGGTYKIIHNVPLAWIDKEKFVKVLGKDFHWTGLKQFHTQAIKEVSMLGFTIPISEVIDLSQFTERSNSEYVGSHPIHGSETGHNLNVNVEKNCWHCFRCNSGGGPLMWLAVKHGIIKCYEARKGALKGVKFLQTLEKAKEEGFDVNLPDEELSPDVTRFFEWSGRNRQFIPAYLTKELMKEKHYITREDDKTVFCYNPNNGIYEANGETILGKEITKKLGKHYSIHRYREVTDLLFKKTMRKLPELPEGLVAVKNGILNITTRELTSFSPDYFVINAISWKYDKDAKCPLYLNFMSEVVSQEADIKGLQEFLGYCLLPDCKYEKALMLMGTGANGKTTMLKIWIEFLGKPNVSAISLQILVVDKFALADLHGKFANIYPDLAKSALKDTGYFKMLVSGEKMSAQEKFKGRFDFVNVTKLIFSANEVPATPDDTDAYFRRWLMVTFPNQFLDDNPKTDPNILETLMTPKEMSGILNWALDGLASLRRQNRFSISKTNEEVREQYTLLSNPEKAFAQECLVSAIGNFATKDDVYKEYIKYCKTHNLPTISKRAFSMRLPQHIPCVAHQTTRMGKKVLLWRDLAIKDKRFNT